MTELEKARERWYGCIPTQADRERWGGFTSEDLYGNELRCGGKIMAKIPKLPGLISRKKRTDEYGHETKYIELTTERWYDRDKQQMRNKRVCIGIDVSHIYDGMMIINDKYREYFNKKGELGRTLFIEKREKKKPAETPDTIKEEKEETNMDNEMKDPEIQAELDRKQHEKDRMDFLNDLLMKYELLVEVHAEKRPDMQMSQNQIRRINGLLKEIREYLAPFEYGEYMEMADEGDEEGEGKGMTYADMEVLLKNYRCVVDAYKYGRIWYKQH